jgi:hypothetical protein
MGSRNFSRTLGIRIAGEIWRVQCERIARDISSRIHQKAARASQEGHVSRGVFGVAAEALHRIRRTIFVGLSRPSLRDL